MQRLIESGNTNGILLLGLMNWINLLLWIIPIVGFRSLCFFLMMKFEPLLVTVSHCALNRISVTADVFTFLSADEATALIEDSKQIMLLPRIMLFLAKPME